MSNSEALKAFRVTNNVEYIQNLKKKRQEQKSHTKSRLQFNFIYFKNKLFFSSGTTSTINAHSIAKLNRKSTKRDKDIKFDDDDDDELNEDDVKENAEKQVDLNNKLEIINLLSLKSNRGSIHYSSCTRNRNLLSATSNSSIDLLTTSISSLQLTTPPYCSFDTRPNRAIRLSTKKFGRKSTTRRKHRQHYLSDVRFIDDENSLFYVENSLSNAVSSVSLIVTEDDAPSHLTKNSNLLLSASKNSDKLNSTKVSLSNSLNDVSEDLSKNEIGRVAKWATGFEKLLDDPIGLQIFTKFLKKEFSQENIEFWIKCENFKSLTELNEMKEAAKEIWSTYLDTSSSYQINVDSKSRSHCKELLNKPVQNMFESAQLHIFSLMKYDSYARFLKSQMYKECIVYEMEGKTLNQILNIMLNNGTSASNSNPQSQKSSDAALTQNMEKLSTNESAKKEKKRSTILPWTKGAKEKKSSKDLNKLSNFQPQLPTIPSSNLDPPCHQQNHLSQDTIDPKHCRVAFTLDSSTSILQVQQGVMVYQVLNKVFNKRQLPWYKCDIYSLNENQQQQLVDAYSDSSILGGKDVVLEERCMFVLSLTPIVINLCIKTNFKRTIQSVIQPILDVYQISLSNSTIYLNSELGPLNLNENCAMIDNQHVLVIHKNQSNLLSRMEINSFINVSIHDFIPHNSEFTFQFDDLGILKQKNSSIFSIQSRVKKHPPSTTTTTSAAAAAATVVDDHEKSNLFELLSKVNNHRIDDQRGLIDTKNLEIPDFLLNTTQQSNGVSPAQSKMSNVSRSRSPIVLLPEDDLDIPTKEVATPTSATKKAINKILFNSPNYTPTKRAAMLNGLNEMIIVNDEFSYIIDTNQSFNDSFLIHNYTISPAANNSTKCKNDSSKVSYV